MPRKPIKNSKGGRKTVHAYHHGDLRRALVDQGTKLVQEQGHPSITVREVARRTGVTHTAAHYHFRTREALLAAIATRGFEEMTASLESAMRAATGARSRLALLGEAYVRHALRRGRLYQLMFSAETATRDAHPELRVASDRMFALLVDAIRDGQETGLVRGGPPVDAALVAWSAAHGFASLSLERRLMLPGLQGRENDELAAIVLRGAFEGIAIA
ncbi:MAG TPA: TetR/AcrR family transcriptional regulator [Polyangiaceae bacterium]|nr:TetR/AcrR family transcriptional regulator [Polyangiaceae bacterium]